MLKELLEQAIAMDANSLDIEYKDGFEYITVYRGIIGTVVGTVPSSESDALFAALNKLKKNKTLTVNDQDYRLIFLEYESFNETMFAIRWKKEPKRKRPPKKTAR